jgi:hypothetical protein
MNVDAVEPRTALADYFAILALKCPLPDGSQSTHHSANNKIADVMAGRGECLAALQARAQKGRK